ncbi:MAG TPA: PEP/pyruvate-binding domain-containing protein, partial [Anaerolineales bacterium]|nr:PEP/pyruvate-binding domain-containing protein [Anaerolineales bacterium]
MHNKQITPEMKSFVLPLSNTEATLETVGGKGMSLAKMINAGLPVPDGFHVTTEAYRQFVTINALQEKILSALRDADPSQPATLEAVAGSICRLFAEARIPPEIMEAILKAYQSLGPKATDHKPSTVVHGPSSIVSVAVRSSATAEDLPEASFAGQQETYLNIRGEEALIEAVKKCWASLWTSRAIAYRIKNNIDQDAVALAVVVQEMVNAEAAGILFTANPINGNRSEMVINAAWGLGEAIVGGLVSPDTIIADKATGRIKNVEVAEKTVITVRTESGTREETLEDKRRKAQVLKEPQVIELVNIARRIEEFYGKPQDIEWCQANNRFYIVQARPITAMPPEWTVPDKTVLYARASLAEHTPSPVTSLFATLGLEVANQATAEMWDRIIGKDAPRLLASDGFYVPINGYVYGGTRIKGNMGLLLRITVSQIAPFFKNSVARWQASRQKFALIVEDWEKKPVDLLSPSELLEGARTVFLAACRYFTDIQTVLPVASMSEIIFTKYYEGVVKRKQDPEATVFLLGSESMALQAEKSLFDIAMWLKNNSVLAEYILHTPTDQLVTDLKQGTSPEALPADLWKEWQRHFQKHLDEFGRTAYEFDFANATPAETPGPILDAIKAFLEGKAHDPHERQREVTAKREQATQAVLNRIGWPRKSWFEKLLNWARDTGPMREDSIFAMGMGHPVIRRMLAELGKRFVAGEAIEAADDIYWLKKSEVEELVAQLENKR